MIEPNTKKTWLCCFIKLQLIQSNLQGLFFFDITNNFSFSIYNSKFIERWITFNSIFTEKISWIYMILRNINIDHGLALLEWSIIKTTTTLVIHHSKWSIENFSAFCIYEKTSPKFLTAAKPSEKCVTASYFGSITHSPWWLIKPNLYFSCAMHNP